MIFIFTWFRCQKPSNYFLATFSFSKIFMKSISGALRKKFIFTCDTIYKEKIFWILFFKIHILLSFHTYRLALKKSIWNVSWHILSLLQLKNELLFRVDFDCTFVSVFSLLHTFYTMIDWVFFFWRTVTVSDCNRKELRLSEL